MKSHAQVLGTQIESKEEQSKKDSSNKSKKNVKKNSPQKRKHQCQQEISDLKQEACALKELLHKNYQSMTADEEKSETTLQIIINVEPT